MRIEQIRSKDGTGTLSYLLTGNSSNEAVLIDPNREDLEVIRGLVEKGGYKVTHLIDTHTHVDHVSASGDLRDEFNAEVVMHEKTKDKWKVLEAGDRFGIGDTLRANAAIPIDRYVVDGDVVSTGDFSIKVLHTPGHTDNHVALLAGENVFTGDLLLIGQAGRSDLPGGNPGDQFESLKNRILPLPDHFRIYPGHDYSDNEFALVGDEKRSNPFLQKESKEDFVEFVRSFFPPIAEAMGPDGKMSLQCGTARVEQKAGEIPTITVDELADSMNGGESALLLDVREPFELAKIGAIEGVVNIPVGRIRGQLNDLPEDKTARIICVCQSGGRSAEATHILIQQGYQNVRSLTGGTGLWIRQGHPVVRSAEVR